MSQVFRVERTRNFAVMDNYCNYNWDFVIVDEVHKLLSQSTKYDNCHELSKHSKNIILLSATPVQQKEEQYLNLLRLILPGKYDVVSKEDFVKQVGKQKKITRAMYNILADLDDLTECMEAASEKGIAYAEDDDCESIYEDLVGGLDDVKDLIGDDFLDEILREIEEECSDKGKALIQEAVFYVCDNYQLERNILRNRRGLISADMAQRDVFDISYLLDPEKNTYEAATYEAIVDWVYQKVAQGKGTDNRDVVALFDAADFYIDAEFCESLIRDEADKEAQPRESAREKLDALVKDTAAKLTPEKTPKAKSKSKKGPEL